MKVIAVKKIKLSSSVPVYDLSVAKTENFCLANGVVAHNSKDLTDAVAGAVYSASIARAVRGETRMTDEHGLEPGRDAHGRMRVSDRPQSPHRRVRQ